MDRRDFIAAGAGLVVLARRAVAEETVAAAGGRLTLTSPGGVVTASILADESGRLSYELAARGAVVVERSPLGLVADGADLGAGVTLPGLVAARTVDESYACRGHHATARNHYRGATIPIASAGGKTLHLEARVFDDGFAWRYILPASGPLPISGEASAFTLPAGSTVYYQTNTKNYEGLHHQDPIERVQGVIGLPVTVALPGAGFLALSEAALFNYSGMTLKAVGGRRLGAVFEDDVSFTSSPGADGMVRSPWRLIIAAPDLNGLVNSDLIANLNEPPDPALFADAAAWIKPGRALWPWWSGNTGDIDKHQRYADGAAALGFEYVLVDEGWERWGRFQAGENKWTMIKHLVEYCRPKGVGVWLWKHCKKLRDDGYRDQFFGDVKDTGAVGVKIDFMDRESRAMVGFYESALRDAARHQLMVNFHGANKPTGEARAWPNEMTREGIRGFEYNRGLPPLPAWYTAALPFTRLIAGHADFTPVAFDPAKIGATSYAHQLALPICLLSEVTNYADRPEHYLDEPAAAPALPVLKEIPTVWDETVVLPPSEIIRCAALARRSGRRWFIGVLNGEGGRALELKLSFLGPGRYQATILSDPADTPAGFIRTEKTVDTAGSITAELRAGGGLVAMLTP
jgi:alpha-glucosidase